MSPNHSNNPPHDENDVPSRAKLTTSANALSLVTKICEVESTLFGAEYLQQLMIKACTSLGFDFGLIGTPDPDNPSNIRTKIMIAHGTVQENITYELRGTPCENVFLGNRVCIYDNNVDKLFPRDELLVNMGISSYIGAPLLAEDKSLLGVFVLMHSNSIEPSEATQSVVEFLASRAGMELLRESIIQQRIVDEAIQQRQERLAALGQVVSGVAHDFNNLLGGLLGHAELLELKLAGNSNAKSNINGIIQTIQRAESTTRELLEFSKMTPVAGSVVSIGKVFAELEDIVKHSFPDLIDLSISQGTETCYAKMDEGHLHQILLNLALNAKDACITGGTIKLRVIDKNADAEGLKVSCDLEKFIGVQIQDNGSGIPHEIQDKIFDPFFSTKTRDSGNGLGLSNVHKILDAYGGYLTLESEVGVGSTFTLCLPRGTQSLEKAALDTHKTDSKFHGKLLLAEDDREIAIVVKEYLETQGFQVTIARDGEEAFSSYTELSRTTDGFDLVIADVNMPKKNGLELLSKIWEDNQELKAVVCTGDASSIEARTLEGSRNCTLLKKPYSLKELTEIVKVSLP